MSGLVWFVCQSIHLSFLSNMFKKVANSWHRCEVLDILIQAHFKDQVLCFVTVNIVFIMVHMKLGTSVKVHFDDMHIFLGSSF